MVIELPAASAFASARPDRVAGTDRQWDWAGLISDNAGFETESGIDLEARDSEGTYLYGARTWALTIPLPVPEKLFWSVTIFDAQTRF
ncbi:MAG: DUF1214 domain-containing protein [Mycobacterium sp.]